MAELVGTPHLDESDLLRLVDGEGNPWELRRWQTHVEACEACASRAERLRTRSARLSDLLSKIQLPPDFEYPTLPVPLQPTQTRHGRVVAFPDTGWLRAAVVAALLLLGAVAVPPVRAAVVEWVSQRWTEVATLFGDRDPEEQVVYEEEGAGSTLWFTPGGEELFLEIDAHQSQGSLVLWVVEGPEGSLNVLDAANSGSEETPILSDRGIRIRNREQSTAQYEVGIPVTVDRVRVRIGDAPPVVLSTQEIGSAKIIELQRPEPISR